MIRDVKSFAKSNALAGEALTTLVQIIQDYATHKDQRCVDESVKCDCGLNTMKIIGEARLAEFRDSLETLRFQEKGER
jgi:hypothetical protein